MARRSRDWNEGLAQDLKDPEFARAFILSSIEEGIPLTAILAKVIRAYGVKEFAAKIKMPSSNIVRALHPKSNPTLSTLERLLKPFKLRLTVEPMTRVA